MRPRLTYANVTSTVCLFLVLAGGTALATHPGGRDTISSADIIDNTVRTDDIRDANLRTADIDTNAIISNKVADGSLTGDDVANGSLTGDDVNEDSLNLAAEGWHEVGAPGEPSFNTSAHCTWTNFNSFHNSAAFLRDRHGFVHLKGLVDADDVPDQVCGFGFADDARIFTLPDGYRPARREVHLSLTTNGFIARINVDAPAGGFNQPSGAVYISPPVSVDGAKEALSLDGISFRCAPSGANGCP